MRHRQALECAGGTQLHARAQSDLAAPTIAVVDSGIDASQVLTSGGRVVQQVNLTTLPNNSPGDGRGHGTFVAGIAAQADARLARALRHARTSSRSTSWTTRALARTSERDRGGTVDPREQGQVQHQGRELLACTPRTRAASRTTRSTRRSRSCGSAASRSSCGGRTTTALANGQQRRSLRTRQRPVQ